MDFSESMKIVSRRIREIEPEHASKIMGCLLLQNCGDQDMIRLAFSPDNAIKTVTNKIKRVLGLSSFEQEVVYIVPTLDISTQFNSFPTTYHANTYSTSHMSLPPLGACWTFPVTNIKDTNMKFDYRLKNPLQHSLNPNDNLNYANLMDIEFFCNSYYLYDWSNAKPSTRARNTVEYLSPKVCHYFKKGFCKYGVNFRYLHGNPLTMESFTQFSRSSSYDVGIRNKDYNILPTWSLRKLEMEIIELLRFGNRDPISLASLPKLYHERYGKTIQGEGYLTGSQRNGKVGCSLTKLLSLMKSSIRLIERSHGQLALVLAEDAPDCYENNREHTEHGGIFLRSQQIYMTSPPESSFTEQDVLDYFNSYGPVQDVRIPSQQKRMFGFITFFYLETVQKILSKRNPHFVCGTRVLVKPYREQSSHADRNHAEKLQQLNCYHSSTSTRNHMFNSVETTRRSQLMRKELLEEQWEIPKEEKRHIKKSQLMPQPFSESQ